MKGILISILSLLLVSVIAAKFLGPQETVNSRMQTRDVTVESPRLAIAVELDKDSLQLRDKTRITVRLKNEGQIPVFVYKHMGWGPGSSFSYVIQDSRGKVVVKSVFADAKDRPPFPEEDFKVLEVAQFITVKRWLDVYTEGITKPGEYRLTVFYHSPVPREFAPSNIRIWAAEDGTLESDPVSFTVVK